jgi:hypothetical protein
MHGRVGDGAMGQRRGGRMEATVTVLCHRDPMRWISFSMIEITSL